MKILYFRFDIIVMEIVEKKVLKIQNAFKSAKRFSKRNVYSLPRVQM